MIDEKIIKPISPAISFSVDYIQLRNAIEIKGVYGTEDEVKKQVELFSEKIAAVIQHDVESRLAAIKILEEQGDILVHNVFK